MIQRKHLTYTIVSLLLLLFLTACTTTKRIKIVESKTKSSSTNQGPIGAGFFRGLTSGDINQDGRPDLIGGAFNPGGIKIWLADTNGFKALPNTFPEMGEVRALAVADLNKDGKLDIVSSIWGTLGAIQIWYQKNKNEWKRFTLTISGKYEDITIQDVNNDGYEDIIAANAHSDKAGGVQVWLGDKDNSWRREQGPTIAGIFHKVLVLDLNKDGQQDILAASWGRPGGIRLWLGNGNGGWSTTTPVTDKGYYRGIATADFNNDGFLDLVAAPFQKGLELWWGNSANKWDEPAKLLDNGSFWDLKVTDINHDSYPDISASSFNKEGVVLLLSQKEEWLQDKRLPQTGNFYSIACADFNADGVKDIAAASYGEGIKIWLNQFDKQSQQKASSSSKPAKRIRARTLKTRPSLVKKRLPTPVLANKTFKTVNGVPEYLIGSNDVLEVTFWEGFTPKKFEAIVNGQGVISLPYVSINVQGLTLKEATDQIIGKLAIIVRNPRVNIRIKEYQSKRVSLLGATMNPGVYKLSGKTSLMDVISQAGGYTDKADLSKIRINRADGKIIYADLYQTISFGDLRENITLDSGDMVFISETKEPILQKKQVYILGEVKHPGTYEFKENLSVLELVGLAGGYTDAANLESTSVIRGDLAKPEILSMNLENLLEKGDLTQNIMLEGNDIVYLPKTFIDNVNTYFRKLAPALQFFLYPAAYRDAYTTGGNMRFSTGVAPAQ